MTTRAEDKLEEAKYFLDILKKISRTITADSQWKEGRDVHVTDLEFKHNFSACICALRSVFDVLLYDYAEKYFKCSPERQNHMDDKDFSEKASASGSSESKEFDKWYHEKFNALRNEHLFYVRITTVHKGGRWMDTKLKNSSTITKEGVKTEEEIQIAGMPETVAVSECDRICYLLDETVKEAREKFR